METVILVPSWQDQNNPRGAIYLQKILAFFSNRMRIWYGYETTDIVFCLFFQNEDPLLLLMFQSVKHYQICTEIEQNATFAASN